MANIIPMYHGTGSSSDGSDSSEFHEYVEHLIETENFNNEIEKGVFKQAFSDGTASLSPKQFDIVQRVIERNSVNCGVCGESLDWNDLIFSEINGDYCSYHSNR